ncbi:hypothetical protein [Streptomyces griseorubiginosus]|uniref:hypothetical protein n=1 Tax=Streptomyces griseorubiginosus TaxID=67304 RepID=UPI0036E3474F
MASPKGVYWLEPDAQNAHVSRLWQAPNVPVDPALGAERFLGSLPQHCVYVALPQTDRPTTAGPLRWPLGVFIHLEHDANNGRPELRIVVDTDGTWEGLQPHPVLLDRPPLLVSTPRAVKRLANSYGLLTALRHGHPAPDRPGSGRRRRP